MLEGSKISSSEHIVAKYYDYICEYEDKRLFKDPYHMLEFIMTFYYLRKYLPPPPSYILDCGCGSGNYSVVLAGMGYNVALVDISERLLSIAKEKFVRTRRMHRVTHIVKASSRDLSMFEDDMFDAVLCFGPLYHLPYEEDQIAAVRELRRVLKSGGILFVSAISYYGVLKTIVMRYDEELILESHRELFEKGIHLSRWHDYRLDVFPDAKFWKPSELCSFMEKHGFITLEMAACEGVFSHLREHVNRVAKDKRKWRRILEIAIETSNEPSIIGVSEHFIWIGKKA